MLLPSFAETVTVALTADSDIDAPGLPSELRGAVPSRQREFTAGRYCAARAISRFQPSDEPRAIGRGPAGEPLWPDGLTGSITHTQALASAAVARLADARSLGIDTETIIPPARAHAVASVVMRPAEAALGGDALGEATRLTLVFSAKEAIFKCLYPVIRRPFYYADVEIRSADLTDGTFAAEIMTTLSAGFERGMVLRGRFQVDDRWVHTGVWLPPDDGD